MSTGFKPVPTLVATSITLIIWFIIPVPESVTPDAWHMFALFVGIIAGIIGKAMPIGALAIIGITLVALTGITADGNSKQAIKDALSSFSNPLTWLIGISIMISRGLFKTGLGARISYYVIAIFGKSTLGIGYSLALSELVLAPVTPSNTARGAGIVHPIMKSIAKSFDSSPETNTQDRIGKYLELVNYNCNPITSAMFITATAPNPLVVDLIAKVTGNEIHLSWQEWAVAMFVPGVSALILMPLIIYFIFPPEIRKTPDAVDFAKNKLEELGAIKSSEWIMLGIFAILLLFWAGIPAMILGKAFAVNTTTTAFIGLSLLLLTGVLTWDDVMKEKGAWDTIVWFGALVMMASFLSKLGLVDWFSNNLHHGIDALGISGYTAALLLLIPYMYAHYFFASTTAHITAMFAAFYAAGIALGAPPMVFGLAMAAVSSLMMSLTHYATGTSPVIFSSGYATLGEWWKVGFAMSVANLLVFLVIGGLWWKFLGYW